MLSSAELSEALSVLEPGEEAALWAGAGTGGGGALVRALLAVGGARAAAVLAVAPEGPARAVLDGLGEALRALGPAGAVQRRHALATTAPLLALRPAWLPRLPPAALSPLAVALCRCARHERDPLPLLHALLSLAALVPAAPAAAAPLWPDLPAALLRPAALAPPPSPPTMTHLQLAQLALFHALYATHPCTLMETLRNELASPASRAAFELTLAPLLRSARLHPALLTGSRQREAEAGRWARAELHDIVAEAHALAGPAPPPPEEPPPPAEPPPPTSPVPGSAYRAALAAGTLRPGDEGWFAPGEVAGQGAPATPVPLPEPEPEAAVEATPENTPAREARAAFRFPSGESGAVRAIGRRSPRAEPSPPLEGGAGGRLARVLAERRALESPVPFAAGVPPGVARPEPLTAAAEPAWQAAPHTDPRALLAVLPPAALTRRPRATRPAPSPRRARSLSPGRGAPHTSTAVQTTDRWPEPYEFLIGDFYNSLPDETAPPASEPSERLETYISSLVGGETEVAGGGEREQLALTQAALMFERWRRDAHAERNRRLLGRVRAARASELSLRQLRARQAELEAECDELRARLAAPRPPPCAAGSGDRELRLEAALLEERSLRARAEARLAEAEAERAERRAAAERDAREAGDDDLHLQALARAAMQAGPRERQVRRLQRELLVKSELEQRLAEAAEAALRPDPRPGDERALRTAAVRAENELAAAMAKADAWAARAQELEAQLTAREAALAEARRGARQAGAEQAAREDALRDKYQALQLVLRQSEQWVLRRQAAVELAGPSGAAAGPSPPPDHS